jgi:hypothetical protein
LVLLLILFRHFIGPICPILFTAFTARIIQRIATRTPARQYLPLVPEELVAAPDQLGVLLRVLGIAQDAVRLRKRGAPVRMVDGNKIGSQPIASSL